MTHRRCASRGRSGITLTEILISILILGVGMVSLATLFPLGLVRMRAAQRLTRGALLAESAAADLGTRNLLAEGSFLHNPLSAPWYRSANSGPFNPWINDTQYYGGDWAPIPPTPPSVTPTATGVSRTIGPGLPVAYDPLWRMVTESYPDHWYNKANPSTPEGRFGSGLGFLRPDQSGVGSNLPSAHGLQRITNLPSLRSAVPNSSIYQHAPFQFIYQNEHTINGSLSQAQVAIQVFQNTQNVLQTFVSPEDLVLQVPDGKYLVTYPTTPPSQQQVASPSPILPDLSGGTPTNDWRFTYFFTGQQTDASNGTVFDGDIVVCENRPFGLDPVVVPYAWPGPGPAPAYQVSGETTVEAVYNYSYPSVPLYAGATVGYGSSSASRSVLLRWPASLPDPDVRVGGWFADTTYERDGTQSASRGLYGGVSQPYPLQRCHWYQVAKKTEVSDDYQSFGGEVGPYRRMTVWTTTPLRAASLLNFPNGGGSQATPVHVDAATIMPSVINVYPRTVYTR